MDGERFNCEACRVGHWCDADFRWPGSRGPAPHPLFTIKGVIDTRTCLLPMVTDFSRELLRWRGHYHNHFLPLAGGMQDQPAAFLDALIYIDSTIAEIERGRNRTRKNGRS